MLDKASDTLFRYDKPNGIFVSVLNTANPPAAVTVPVDMAFLVPVPRAAAMALLLIVGCCAHRLLSAKIRNS